MVCGYHCGVDLIPVCFVSILFITLAISFTIAVSQHDIAPWFPAISDTATESPESNIFAQLVNIASFVGFILVYVRYLQVKRDVEWLEGNRPAIIINRWSLFFGLLAVFGSSIVANFPEKQVLTVHLIGALMLFLSGNIYSWTQVVISFYMKRFGFISSCMYSTRFIFSLVSTVSFAICMIMSGYALKEWPSGDNLHWNSDDPGYKEHVIGDAFEWLMVFFFLFLFLTFTKEFCYSKLQVKLVGYQEQYEPIAVQSGDIEKQVPVVHDIGALLLFLFGIIYTWTQVVISFHMKTFGLVGFCVCSTRFIFSLVSTISFVICLLMTGYAAKKWPSGDNLHWNSDDPGYKEHVIGDAFEWLMVVSFLVTFLTFTKEFCNSKLQVKLVGCHEQYEPLSVRSDDIAV